MKRRYSTKGSFFLIDAFIGLSVLVLAVVVINNFEVVEPSTQQSYTLLNDYTEILFTTEVRDFSNPYVDMLIREGYVPMLDEPMMNLIARLQKEGDLERARNLTNQTIKGMIPDKFSFSYTVGGTEIFRRQLISQSEASLVLTNTKMTVVRMGDTDLYGPVATEVALWQ